MAKSPNWSTHELNILKDIYPTTGCNTDLLKLLPGRTAKAINVKCSKLGLKVLNPWNAKKSAEKYRQELLYHNITAIDDYVSDKVKITHSCNTCMHQWKAQPHNILAGHGCPMCNTGFGSMRIPKLGYPGTAYLYVTEFFLDSGEAFIKVGITSNHTLRRLKDIRYQIGVDSILKYNKLRIIKASGESIFRAEQQILNDITLIPHKTKLVFTGSTELFNISCRDKLIQMVDNFEFETIN